MTYNELTTMSHIASAKQVYGFLCLTAEDGYQITDYANTDPIERFYAARGRSLLVRTEYAKPYRVITDAEAATYQAKRQAAQKAAQEETTQQTE